jgi:aryl-alcohol dehydrogenase-like predicted oxidoreductase
MLTRAIPKSGEQLPAVGLGTWSTFDVEPASAAAGPLADVMRVFVDGGGRVIDSSPMYGRAEAVTGALTAKLPADKRPFFATKVWTQGKAEGAAQIAQSFARLGVDVIDLLQVHNLVDWQTHLPVLRAMKEAGRIRYVGVTHYARSAFDELEQMMRRQDVDFVQLPYSLEFRDAEERLLPAARDTATAVLVMRPFAEGALLRRLAGKPLPPFARELGCDDWATLCLKWILGHPAVTAPLPATSNPEHARADVAAMSGALPDEKMRRALVESLAR